MNAKGGVLLIVYTYLVLEQEFLKEIMLQTSGFTESCIAPTT